MRPPALVMSIDDGPDGRVIGASTTPGASISGDGGASTLSGFTSPQAKNAGSARIFAALPSRNATTTIVLFMIASGFGGSASRPTDRLQRWVGAQRLKPQVRI